jgi:hypothetical protein
VYIARRAFWLAILLFAVGCASPSQPGSRAFDFRTDTLSYSNQLVWEYRLDPVTQKVVTSKKEPPPTYSHHCFVVVRAARQFFDHARFDPTLPKRPDYTSIVRSVVGRSPREASPEEKKIVISGYANLREFSRDHAQLLQRECGGAWQSYFQRGHWRMVFPFTRRHQQRTAERLVANIGEHRPQIVHIARFPSLAINHALLLYAAEKTTNEVRFLAYDPNNSDSPSVLAFDPAGGNFSLPSNAYFPRGGRVDVYPVFNGPLY